MKGAREFASLFETGQIGRLYIVSGSHARGTTFHIFVLPAGVEAVGNGRGNAPLNPDAVEVYGIIGGNPGWTESYGWIHQGKWQDDFYRIVDNRLKDKQEKEKAEEVAQEKELKKRNERVNQLLSTY
jgi:hypothetical protein